jgi:uncharacterized phage protein (TIGR02218 family)
VSYSGQESSVESGKPIELYLFVNEGLVTEKYAYTSATQNVTFDSVTYTPKIIERTKISVERAEPGTDKGLELTLPASDALVLRYTTSVPPKRDLVTIYRRHANDGATPETITYYRGYISSVSFQGHVAKVKVAPFATILSRNVPKRIYRGLCTHVLYDTECKVLSSNPSFSFAVNVTAVSTDGLTVTIAGTGIGGRAADYYDGGMLRRGSIDRRMVLDFVDTGSNTGTCKVLLPFPSLAVGEVMTLLAGCDHSITTCRTKFANEVNYGGFPWVPTRNPFNTGIVQ